MTVNTAVLKFLAWPVAKLIVVTGCLYFIVSCVCAWVTITVADRLWQKRRNKFFEAVFYAFSIYAFLYLALGYNAFLSPGSYIRHPFIYAYIFPMGAGQVDIPEVNFLNTFFYICAGYWCALLVSYFFCLTHRAKKNIFLMGICFFAVVLVLLKSTGLSKEKKFYQKDNIIFIGLDSFQYNQLSQEWGAISSPAPDILKFIKEATYFREVWTPFARTFPSYTCILTGRYPFHNGIRANLLPDKYEDSDNVYLGDILRNRNYWRFYATDDVRFSNIRPRHGFDEIFTPNKKVSGFLLTSFYDYSLANILIYHDIFPWFFSAINDNRAAAAYNPRVFMRHVIGRIKKLPREKKQFIVIHLCANHHPYTAVYPYARDPVFRTRSEFCMLMVNEQFKMLVDYLKASGLYDRSLIAVFSDHGSGWDATLKQLSHGSDFGFLEAYKSVLAFKGEGFPSGKEVKDRVRTIDIYPTVLDLLKIKVPYHIDGKSLLPLAYDKAETSPRSAFAETGYTFDFYYEENAQQQSQRIQSEIKRFRVDPENGFIFINDGDYREIMARKWFMMIEGDKRFVYRPWNQESRLYNMDGSELLDDNKKLQMKQKIETLMLK